ncbi:MAG: hypothetical protein CMK07_02615 [Ponticaulis sp.]|nr:hypothetical protein [Ponticaulis sp.]
MTKLFYRGYELRTEAKAVKEIRHEDLVYRGTHYDPAIRRAANENNETASKLFYRGAAAA